MTMDVEVDQPEAEIAERIDKEGIVDYLTDNDKIFFKSQQRGEDDLTKQEKTKIALEIYDKSKLNFLLRFGKYLQRTHLDFFQQFTQDGDESDEIEILLKEFYQSSKTSGHVNVKNRRYEALKLMVQDDSYFSEIEMMKRNPLLYDQLVGQYLTEEEKKARDKIHVEETTKLSNILMEGIERDDAEIKKREQIDFENGMEEEEDEEEDMEISDESLHSVPICSMWGEFIEENDSSSKITKRIKGKSVNKHITPQEQELLKEEFISTMYQHFLDGKDEDFDYDSVDNNDQYDNSEMKEYDAEDKYFDSEEPEIVDNEPKDTEESEDELDIYMSALNQHPAVSQLSKDIERL